jgi:hypothetical protein
MVAIFLYCPHDVTLPKRKGEGTEREGEEEEGDMGGRKVGGRRG